ncbi:hypothetical protein TNCV_2013681 [Trichonephila clavipes]|nr:hypothetical protein TNCV_2013681 [Trichonephila clavipes]
MLLWDISFIVLLFQAVVFIAVGDRFVLDVHQMRDMKQTLRETPVISLRKERESEIGVQVKIEVLKLEDEIKLSSGAQHQDFIKIIETEKKIRVVSITAALTQVTPNPHDHEGNEIQIPTSHIDRV